MVNQMLYLTLIINWQHIGNVKYGFAASLTFAMMKWRHLNGMVQRCQGHRMVSLNIDGKPYVVS